MSCNLEFRFIDCKTEKKALEKMAKLSRKGWMVGMVLQSRWDAKGRQQLPYVACGTRLAQGKGDNP